jgi:hypothetical protein
MTVDVLSTVFSESDAINATGSIVSSVMLAMTVDGIAIIMIKTINVFERVEIVSVAVAINVIMVKTRNVVEVPKVLAIVTGTETTAVVVMSITVVDDSVVLKLNCIVNIGAVSVVVLDNVDRFSFTFGIDVIRFDPLIFVVGVALFLSFFDDFSFNFVILIVREPFKVVKEYAFLLRMFEVFNLID